MSLPKPISGQVFVLDRLFTKLLNFAMAKFRRGRCYKPEDCASEVVNECLIYEPERREAGQKPRRITIKDDKTIHVEFPDARNQQSVLYEHLKKKIWKRYSRCRDCKGNRACESLDNFGGDDGGERRGVAEPLSDAASPLEIAESANLIDMVIGAIEDPKEQEQFLDMALGERTSVEIGQECNQKDSTIRKRYERNKKVVAAFFKRTFSRGGGNESR